MRKDDKNTAIYVAYEENSPFDPTTPEKNLLRAILVSAMSDAGKNGDAQKRALEYFLDQDEEYIFSFRSVCNHLELDPLTILRVVGLTATSNGASQGGSASVNNSNVTNQRTQI